MQLGWRWLQRIGKRRAKCWVASILFLLRRPNLGSKGEDSRDQERLCSTLPRSLVPSHWTLIAHFYFGIFDTSFLFQKIKEIIWFEQCIGLIEIDFDLIHDDNQNFNFFFWIQSSYIACGWRVRTWKQSQENRKVWPLSPNKQGKPRRVPRC